MKIKNGIMLVLTAFIWGTAFVAQSVGMDYLGPFTFNGVRSLIGGAALLPCIWLFQKGKGKATEKPSRGARKELIAGGIACGLLLFAASSLQQIGIQYTTAGKAGFITAFYIVIVPVLGIFLHKKISGKVWGAVAIALAGLYFLCITEKFAVGKGDILIFLCALVFSIHIVEGWAPLLYAGVLSCGVAYTLQIIGQKNVNPAVASLILSLESCFSVLAGWMVLGEKLSMRESVGCVLMFGAIILAQLPDRKKEELQYE